MLNTRKSKEIKVDQKETTEFWWFRVEFDLKGRMLDSLWLCFDVILCQNFDKRDQLRVGGRKSDT